MDELARAGHMYFFVPLPTINQEEKFSNPSLEVAKHFKITPAQLPGIVLFTRKAEVSSPIMLNPGGVTFPVRQFGSAIYFPLETALFEDDPNRVEEVFRDLFTIIQDCQNESEGFDELLTSLQKEIQALKRKRAMRPAMIYMRGTLVTVLTFSASLIGEMLHTALLSKGSGFMVSG